MFLNLENVRCFVRIMFTLCTGEDIFFDCEFSKKELVARFDARKFDREERERDLSALWSMNMLIELNQFDDDPIVELESEVLFFISR